MNCSSAREVLAELLDSRTSPTALLEARTHVADCPACQQELAALRRVAELLDAPVPAVPSARLRRHFQATLAEEKLTAARESAAPERAPRRSLAVRWRWVLAPLAGGALLALGFVGGWRFATPPVTPAPAADHDTRRQLADLQQRVDSMSQLVGYSLLLRDQRPTNDRLRALLTAATTERPNPQVVDELIAALALDPSAHVRLRALDGLLPYLDQETVRAGVLACLPREENPLVQVSMIDFLATARDLNARPAIERISQNARADRSVRDAAQRALTHF